jgi:hypothetical protein
VFRNIIKYTDDEKPRNDYPKKIVSPVRASSCCSDENREVVGSNKDIDGFKFVYKICNECGHAVKFFFPGRGTGKYYERLQAAAGARRNSDQ